VPPYHYLDSSAIVKLVIHEPESAALRRFSRRNPDQATSGLAWAEVQRAVRRAEPSALTRARQALDGLLAIGVTPGILADAAKLDPIEVRTLDAIHLASAMTLAAELVAIVTYDDRMARAAMASGIAILSPR
jgi:predicted nucleic acid-binding protein